jgi:L-threonylcarbamoyladenylate synthase
VIHATPALPAALTRLRVGAVVAFPTETVYGLGADAENPAAVARIYALKGRPSGHPVIVHLADAAQMDVYAAQVSPAARALAAAFWPGPLTLIVRRSARVPDAVTGGQDTVGLRVPAHPLAHALLAAFGRGIAAPSANRFGRVSPTSAAHVRAEFAGEDLLVLDGGDCEVGIESTIVDVSGRRARVLRPGAIGADALARVLGHTPRTGARGRIRTPGLLARHYAPVTPLELVPGRELPRRYAQLRGTGAKVAVLRCGPSDSGRCGAALPAEPRAYARGLYAALRALDAGGYDRVLVESPPRTGSWRAVRDRLTRAAHG